MARHLALPLAIADGRLATLEQDSPAEISQSVALLLSTEPGERLAAPDYGYPSPLGRGVDDDEVADLIADWEDRADPALVEVTASALAEQYVTVQASTPTGATTTTTDGEG